MRKKSNSNMAVSLRFGKSMNAKSVVLFEIDDPRQTVFERIGSMAGMFLAKHEQELVTRGVGGKGVGRAYAS
jgi:hypothetical protein